MTINIIAPTNPYNYTILFLSILIYTSCSPNKVFHISKDIQQLPLETYQETLKQDTNHYLVDVRTSFEYKAQHFDEAINISWISLKFRREFKKLDRNKTVFIYCETAHRSPYAAKGLRKMGFNKIVDLQGGYKSYRKKIEKENARKILEGG